MWINPYDAQVYELSLFLSYTKIVIDTRVYRRHPDMSEELILNACKRIIQFGYREPPGVRYVFASAPIAGEPQIEVIGTLLEDGTFEIFHAMRLREKIAQELRLVRSGRNTRSRRRS